MQEKIDNRTTLNLRLRPLLSDFTCFRLGPVLSYLNPPRPPPAPPPKPHLLPESQDTLEGRKESFPFRGIEVLGPIISRSLYSNHGEDSISGTISPVRGLRIGLVSS